MEFTVNQQHVYAYTGTHDLVADKPAVVFIHGAGMDHSAWILQSRYFAYHGFNLLALDLPGHGRSEGKPLTSIEALADWLAAVFDAVNVNSASLIGHSMGSLTALECAARHPQRVQSIALLGIACPMPVGSALLDAAKANDHAAIDMIVQWGHSPRAHLGGNRFPGLWIAGSGERLLEQAADDVLFTDLNACNEYQHGLESADAVQCPTLLVLGAQDQMTPARAAQGLREVLAKVQVVKIPNCGHMMMSEKPEETLDVLIDFIGKPD